MDEVDIITVGCSHLQKRNKLKGIAMQKLILETMKNRKEDISLKRILQIAAEKLPEYYTVEHPFKVGDHLFNIKHEFVHISEFPDLMQVFIKKKIINRKWKVCSYCGQPILAEKQRTRKCRKCKQGYFRFQSKDYLNWKLEYQGDKKTILPLLVEHKYIKQVKKLTKRADFFHFSNNIFYIYESKNKELSGLSFSDLYTSLIYPLILKKCGYSVRELKLIFNGFWNEDLEIQIQKGFADKFDFNVEFYPIKKYLENNNIHVKEIVIEKINGKYMYNVIYGHSDQISVRIKGED